MTIASETNRMAYVGTGIAGPYAFNFRIFAATDLRVTTRDTTGLETTLQYPGDFTVSGVGAASGSLTLTTALPADYALSIRRVRPITQGTELRNQGPYQAATVEDALDERAMVDQQLYDEILRSIRLPESIDPADFDPTLPATLTPGNALVVNATGDGFSMATVDEATLSAWNAANNLVLDVFTSGVNFTAGVSTALTLSADPGSIDNLLVVRRTSGATVVYQSDQYTLAGSTLTFTAVIPASTTRIEVRYLHTYQVNTADAQNVKYAPLSGAGTDVRTRLRTVDDRLASLSISITDAPYSADPSGATDACGAFNAAAAAVAAAGGGIVYVPAGVYKIDAEDLEVSRLVTVRGAGSGGSILRSTTGKKLKVKGSAGNWDQGIEHIALDGVAMWYGELNTDFANGCYLSHVDINGCDVGVYYGWNCFQNAIINTKIHNCDVGVHYDLATGGITSGALEYIGSGSAIFQCRIGIRYTGGGVGGFDAFLNDINIQDITEAGIALEGAGEDSVYINVAHFELYGASACFIKMDGGQVFLDGMWALSVTERCWFDVSGGTLFLQKGRGSFANNKFAKITGGTIVVDPDFVFCGSRFWGTDAQPLVTAGSSGGAIVNTRSQYVAQHNNTITQLTNASPGPVAATTIRPRDGNEYVWEFDVECTAAVATNNSLRIEMANGHSVVRVDLVFPLVVGGARVRVCYSPTVSLSASAVFAPSAGGNAVYLSATTADTSTLDDERFLNLQSIGGGGTVATMQARRFYSYVCGPHQTGL